MKRQFLLFTLPLLTFLALADTTIANITIDFSTMLRPVDAQGFPVSTLVTGGRVDFTGQGPVFVSLNVGGLTYTTPTDETGNYTFSVYPNGATRFTVNAWSTDAAPA